MAAKFYTGVDLCNQELLRAKFQNLTAAPTTYAAGMVYYDNSTANNTKGRAILRSASSWEALAFLKDLEGYTTTGAHSALAGTVSGIDARLQSVETIFKTDNDNAINKWNEVVAFLAGIEGGTLDAMLETFAKKTTTISAGTGLTGTIKLDGTGSFSLATSGVTAGTYPKVTVDKYGRVTKGSSLAESDIPSLSITKITDLQSTIAGISESISDIASLFTNGAANKAVADQYGNNIANTYATAYNLGELATRVTSTENSIRTLTNRINETDGVLNETIVKVTAAEGNISALTKRVTAAEGNITTLMEWYEEVGQYFKYDSGNKAWYLNGDFYTTGQNAAGEAGSASEGGGSGSGIILNFDAVVDALGYTPARTSDLTNLTNRVTTLEGKATSVSYTASSASSAVIGILSIDGSAKNVTLRDVNVTSALGYTPTKKVVKTITANGSTSQTINHNLGSRDVIVQLFTPNTPYEQVYADVRVTDTNNVTIAFAETPNVAYKVVIIG